MISRWECCRSWACLCTSARNFVRLNSNY